jgi:biopolymer transport protein ExbD
MLNEEVFDTPASRELPGMSRTLRRIQQTVTAQHSKVLATVRAEPEAGFQRVVDVMDALSRAGIANVTFEVPGH